MPDASTSEHLSPALLKVAARAQREPAGQFHALAYLIDEAALARAYHRLRPKAAVGVDGLTKEQYGQCLEQNLQRLHARLKAGQYRHQPLRRVHIPKGRDRTRPIGISALEDKVVQGAIRDVLEAIYEQDFLACSYGFRPGRRAHDALRALNRAVYHGHVNWILEADIVSFFDSVDRTRLREILQKRVADGALQRLIGKCLHVGVLEGTELSTPEVGTAQGSVLSPLLGNIYLHDGLDLWFEQVVKPQLRGRALLVRYCDDFVLAFEHQEDAVQVRVLLGQRMEAFGLRLHPTKTRLLPFGRPPTGQGGGKGPATFDFLGFTLYWRRTRSGRWEMACKTRRERLSRTIATATDWCRVHRHLPIPAQHARLTRLVQGHMNYFGVNGNTRNLYRLLGAVSRAWFKWLTRRSQRARLTWERFQALAQTYPLPRPRVMVQLWGT
jgi:RNA-directed DNA polymerase